ELEGGGWEESGGNEGRCCGTERLEATLLGGPLALIIGQQCPPHARTHCTTTDKKK
ncbi:hypothetical protein KUCAC02_009011, partial [Chaenocephalus aceratus]